jgi:hypothetical protein
LGKLDSRKDGVTATCDTCGGSFKPRYNSTGRFCGYACAQAGSRRIPHEEIRRLYVEDGRQPSEIAEIFGLRVTQVYSAVKRMKVTRSRSEALSLWHANAGPDAREERAHAAHAAKRGRPGSPDSFRRGAVTNQRIDSIVGPHEVVFAEMLRTRGIGFLQQTALDVYNIDFTLTEYPVAVEIVSGGGANGRWEALHKRRIHVLHHWHLFEVKFRTGRRVFAEPVIDKLIAFAEKVSADPTPFGQYRMVWPNGDEIRTNARTPRYSVGGS